MRPITLIRNPTSYRMSFQRPCSSFHSIATRRSESICTCQRFGGETAKLLRERPRVRAGVDSLPEDGRHGYKAAEDDRGRRDGPVAVEGVVMERRSDDLRTSV